MGFAIFEKAALCRAFRSMGASPSRCPLLGCRSLTREARMKAGLHDYRDLKLKLGGIVPPGHGFHQNLLFDALYSSCPETRRSRCKFTMPRLCREVTQTGIATMAPPSSSHCRASSRHIFR